MCKVVPYYTDTFLNLEEAGFFQSYLTFTVGGKVFYHAGGCPSMSAVDVNIGSYLIALDVDHTVASHRGKELYVLWRAVIDPKGC